MCQAQASTGVDRELEVWGPFLPFSCEKFLNTIVCYRKHSRLRGYGSWPPSLDLPLGLKRLIRFIKLGRLVFEEMRYARTPISVAIHKIYPGFGIS